MHQVAVDKTDDDLSRLGLGLEGLPEPYLYEAVIAKATGDGEYHCHDGNDGQQRSIGQGCRLLQDTLGSKETDGQHHLLENLQKDEAHGGYVILGDSPEVLFEEVDDILGTDGHGFVKS